jgi:toxin HigB-1
LEIRYKDKKLHELCTNHQAAVKKLGSDGARKLQARLADLEAAVRVSDVQTGKPHVLSGDRAGQIALNLAGGWRLVLAAAHEPNPQLASGGIDWQQVSIIRIEYIGDYHD